MHICIKHVNINKNMIIKLFQGIKMNKYKYGMGKNINIHNI